MPDPDLLIRTSGEMRVSNFLLWQIAYAEIFVTETLWPDFNRARLLEAFVDFQKRDRRYGGIGENEGTRAERLANSAAITDFVFPPGSSPVIMLSPFTPHTAGEKRSMTWKRIGDRGRPDTVCGRFGGCCANVVG